MAEEIQAAGEGAGGKMAVMVPDDDGDRKSVSLAMPSGGIDSKTLQHSFAFDRVSWTFREHSGHVQGAFREHSVKVQ
jgi:hypothetical protein